MKILAISDWHNNLSKHDLSNTGVDTLVIAGDMLNPHISEEMYLEWLESLDFKSILVIPGNHDMKISEHWKPESDKVFNPIVEPVTIEGITFGGICWSSAYTLPHLASIWSYMSIDEYMLSEKIKALPKCDVLISHSPPKYFLDQTTSGDYIGLLDMIPWATKVDCKHIICGHVHEQGGLTRRSRFGIRVYNVAQTKMYIEII